MELKNRSQMAREVGVSRPTLLSWEERRLIPSAKRISGNRSVYSPVAQGIIRTIAEAAR